MKKSLNKGNPILQQKVRTMQGEKQRLKKSLREIKSQFRFTKLIKESRIFNIFNLRIVILKKEQL